MTSYSFFTQMNVKKFKQKIHNDKILSVIFDS